jgi:NAD(P) transhydrogenase subunit alpha
MATVLVPKETRDGETRVAASPDSVKRFVKAGLTVQVERGAGASARVSDDDYQAAGAVIIDADQSGWAAADLVVKVAPPTLAEAANLKDGGRVLSIVIPAYEKELIEYYRDHKITCYAMDLIPRISRAQSMDVLSSQATVSGYKAVLLAASQLEKFCPLLMTAAGTVPPAKCVVFGAGVAGLQAIATAKRLGCRVEATDIRLAAKEQIESLGAKFIDVPGMEDLEDEHGYAKEVTPEFLAKQREEVAKRVAEADIVITTALVPGRPAPKLISEEMVKSMPVGSVIVDLAVESGGNCVLSENGKIVEKHGVTLIGISNLPATMPVHASELYAKNVLNLVNLMIDEGNIQDKLEDECLDGCLLTHEGEVKHERAKALFETEGASS